MTTITNPSERRVRRTVQPTHTQGRMAADRQPATSVADQYLGDGYKIGERFPVVSFASRGPGSLFELIENTRERFGKLHALEGADLTAEPVSTLPFTRKFYLDFQASVYPSCDRNASAAASPEAPDGPVVLIVPEGRFVHAGSYATPWRFEPAPGVDANVRSLPLFTADDVRRNLRELNQYRSRVLTALRDEDRRRHGVDAVRVDQFGVNHQRHARRFWLGVFADRFEDRFDETESRRLSPNRGTGPIVLVMSDRSRYLHEGNLASPWRFEGTTSDGPWHGDASVD